METKHPANDAPQAPRIEGDIAFIPLTQGHEAIIDASDLPLVSQHRWWASVRRRADGSVSAVYARRDGTKVNGRAPVIYLHRFVSGAACDVDVDHSDGNGLNNRRSNLRVASRAQNIRNAKKRRDNKSGAKGVWQDPRYGTWQASITVNRKRVHLGSFRSLDAAAAAYAEASKLHHGEFGRAE
jgi:hypothetical protein